MTHPSTFSRDAETGPRPKTRLTFLSAALAAAVAAAGTRAAMAAPSLETCDPVDVVAQALPAIVNITTVRVEPEKSDSSGKHSDEQIETFVGSGFVVDPSGIIVTNRHVIQGAAIIRVTFANKVQVPAQLVAASDLVDVAVLKVNMPKPLPILQFGDSDALRLGQLVVAVGNPIGLGISVSTGVVSGLDRNLMRTMFDDFIQTDASINPGNSGGALLDCAGKVIGVNTALISNSTQLGSIGLGFAMPSNDVSFVEGKLRHPDTDRPNWVGLGFQDVTFQLQAAFGRSDTAGAVVTTVDREGPAARAGIVPGDIITAVDTVALPDARAIHRAIVMKPSGKPIALSFWREGRMETATVSGQPWPHLTALRSDVLASAASVARAEAAGLGLQLAAITPTSRQQFGLHSDRGVLVDRVTPGSQAATVGLSRGDLIEQVGSEQATAPAQVMHALAGGGHDQRDMVALLVTNKNRTRWITLYTGRVDVAKLIAASPAPAEAAQVGLSSSPPR